MKYICILGKNTAFQQSVKHTACILSHAALLKDEKRLFIASVFNKEVSHFINHARKVIFFIGCTKINFYL